MAFDVLCGKYAAVVSSSVQNFMAKHNEYIT